MSREIDALVAERVMGNQFEMIEPFRTTPTYLHPVWKCVNTGEVRILESPIPHYSTDIAAANLIIEHVNLLLFTVDRENCCGVRYDARCYNKDDLSDKVNVTASTAPLAICLAILKFKGIDIKQFDRGLR